MIGCVVLPAGARIRSAWRNGGGSTCEIISSPAGSGLDDFDWRLSIAEVGTAGPFSIFPDVDRHLRVLSGELALDFEDGRTHRLRSADPEFVFSGDCPVYGRPLTTDVRDLNLMVRRGRFEGRIKRYSQIDLKFVGVACVVVACSPMTLDVEGLAYPLGPLDALAVKPGIHMCGIGQMMLVTITQPRLLDITYYRTLS